MSYLENKITIEEYLNNIQNRGKKNHLSSILNQFDIFCKQKYNKSSQQILDDLFDEINKTHSNDKVYILFNHFKDWLLVDHPEIEYSVGKNQTIKRTIKTRHPNTVQLYLIKIRSIFEEIGNIEINSRLFNKRIKVSKTQEEDPEPFTKEQPRIEISKKTKIELFVKPKTPISQKQKMFEKFYRNELEKIIPKLIEKWENKVGVKIKQVRIKKMKTKWGTCNAKDKRIWLNLELVKQPPNCIDYVFVHELVHLKERKHNERFLSILEQAYPRWRQSKEELNHGILSYFEWGCKSNQKLKTLTEM